MRLLYSVFRVTGLCLTLVLGGCLKNELAGGFRSPSSEGSLAQESASFCSSITSSGLRAFAFERDCRAVYGEACSLEVFTRDQEQRLCHVHRTFPLIQQPRMEFTNLTRSYSFGQIQLSDQFEVEIRNQGRATASNCFANISNLNDFSIEQGNLGTIPPNGGVRFRVIADPVVAQTPQTRTGIISVSCQSPSGALVTATSGEYSIHANVQNGGENTPPPPPPGQTPAGTPNLSFSANGGFAFPYSIADQSRVIRITNNGNAASGPCQLALDDPNQRFGLSSTQLPTLNGGGGYAFITISVQTDESSASAVLNVTCGAYSVSSPMISIAGAVGGAPPPSPPSPPAGGGPVVLSFQYPLGTQMDVGQVVRLRIRNTGASDAGYCQLAASNNRIGLSFAIIQAIAAGGQFDVNVTGLSPGNATVTVTCQQPSGPPVSGTSSAFSVLQGNGGL